MYKDLYYKINKASEKNSLTFFVGSGVSLLSNAPSWSALIDHFCERMNIPKKSSYSYDEYLKIPQMFYYHIKEDYEKYYEIIKTIFNQEDLETNEVHKKIYSLNPQSIITTNFDDLLEKSSVQNFKTFKSIGCDNDISKINGDKFILKIHGDLKNRNIVLKEEDYLNYGENFKLIETLLKSIFSTNQVVFIGYSLSDYNVRLILNWVKYLLKDNFNKPIFIYTQDDKLNDEEIRYYESRGLSVIDYKKCSEEEINERDYLKKYMCVLNSITNYSDFSINDKTEEEAFEVLFKVLHPLDKLNALRFQDIREKLSSYEVIIDNVGLIVCINNIPKILKYFIDINNMNDSQLSNLPKDIAYKYKSVVNILSKARIKYMLIDDKYIRLKNSKIEFSDRNCILFDYFSMEEYISKKYITLEENYKKAYYLTKLKRFDESYNLFTQVAITSFRDENYILYYLSQANRRFIYTAMNKINKKWIYYSKYGLKSLLGCTVNIEDFDHVFENLPIDFQKEYKSIKDICSPNLLFENSYYAFEEGKKLEESIEKNTIELGLTKADVVVSRINNNIHFFIGNGLYSEEFVEFKGTIKNLMSLLAYKYSVQNQKKISKTDFDDLDNNIIIFDEIDFYCFMEYYSDKEIVSLFKKYEIDNVEFDNKHLVNISILNIFRYYDKIVSKSKDKFIKEQFEYKMKNCLYLLRYMDISQSMLDEIIEIIFKYEYRWILIDEIILFINAQIYLRKMSSEKLSILIEEKLVYYIDEHIKAIKNKTNYSLYSNSKHNYYDLVYFIDIEHKHNYKKLNDRVSKIVRNEYDEMINEVIKYYYDYLSKYQKNKVVEWINNKLENKFNFEQFYFLALNTKEKYKKFIDYLIEELDREIFNYNKSSKIIDMNIQYFDKLNNIGMLCLLGKIDKKYFEKYLGYSKLFDFFYKYNKFDFNDFDIVWLMNFNRGLLEKISNNIKVKKV